MQLKTFSAKSSAAVLSKIRAEFGSDAVILETREEDGLVHMTAALERNVPLPDSNEEAPRPIQRQRKSAPQAPSSPGGLVDEELARAARQGHKKNSALKDEGAAVRNAAAKAYRSAASRREAADSFLDSSLALPAAGGMQWQEEWSYIKAHLLALMKPALRLDLLAPRQRLALEYLHGQGVEDGALLRLYERLRDDPAANILAPLAELVGVRPWVKEEWPQRIHFISGAFGSGKTSVAIRMALALRRSDPDCRVCLVNADATRGNGRLLLRHYCELSDLDYSEASSTLELVAALAKAERAGYDRILVDLPGIGKDRRLTTLLADAGMAERQGEKEEDAAVHLALPPQYSGTEMRNILERYKSRHSGSLVWTKLDEAVQFGQIVNVGIAGGLPVSALSFGPGLGHSFTAASPVMLWRLLFKQELPQG